MKKIWCLLAIAGSIGICSDGLARGHGGYHGHHFGGRGGFHDHRYRGHGSYYRKPWGGHYYRGHGHYYRGHGHYYRGHGHYYRGYPARGRVGIGFYFGAPYGYRYYPYYGYPYYPSYPYYGYPPPVVTVPSQPPVYIQREPQRSASGQSEGYWYYCSDPPGYYPYVKECDDDWEPVPARPPGK